MGGAAIEEIGSRTGDDFRPVVGAEPYGASISHFFPAVQTGKSSVIHRADPPTPRWDRGEDISAMPTALHAFGGGYERAQRVFTSLDPRADLLVLAHEHGDATVSARYNGPETLEEAAASLPRRTGGTILIASPSAAYPYMDTAANGEILHKIIRSRV